MAARGSSRNQYYLPNLRRCRLDLQFKHLICLPRTGYAIWVDYTYKNPYPRKNVGGGEVSETHFQKNQPLQIILPKLICRIPVVTLQEMFRSWVATANGIDPVTFGNGQVFHLKLGPFRSVKLATWKNIWHGNTLSWAPLENALRC